MERLYKISLVAVVAAMMLACKKTQPEQPKPQPEPKKDTTFVLEAAVSGEAKYDGSGDLSYTVKSIRKIDKKEEFMPWTMEFSMDGGSTWSSSKPDFITLTTQENNGDLTAKSYTAKFTAQEKTLQTSDIILKGREVKNNVDLSNVDVKGNAHGKGTTTANCYVIHNPGTYKFPTIYGNAMKNGQKNERAYKSSKQGQKYILSPFINAYGQGITKPQIEGINNACLIWQDTQNLISNISFDSANQYVKFEVDKATIHNGNAIIAVRDASNTILWSWHIWVTEEDLTPVEITNYQGINYNILPVNLGWCEINGAELYKRREVMVKVKQSSSGGEGKEKQIVFNLLQGTYRVSISGGNNPYYQWGRKDPMLPGNGIAKVDKTCYTTDDRYQFAYQGHGVPLNTSDIKEYIRNPHKFNTKHEMDGKYYNLWSTDNDKTVLNDDVVIKSVYDPCPVGYSVPASNAFTGFAITGDNTINSAEYNVKGTWDKGWYFYTKKNKQGDTVFFPACGDRYLYPGSLNDVSSYGYYWVAGPYNGNYGRYFRFSSGGVSPLYSTYRGYGYAVRPVQEK